MKKFVKIISVVMCALLLVTGFFFAPKNINSLMLNTHAATTQSEAGQTYNYDAEITTDNNSFGNFAISNIEYYEYSGGFLLHFKATYSSWSRLIRILSTTGSFSDRKYFTYFLINSSELDFSSSLALNFNLLMIPEKTSCYFETISTSLYNGVTYTNFDLICDSTVTVDYYISNLGFRVTSPSSSVGANITFELDNSKYSTPFSDIVYDSDIVSSFSDLIDMNSSTDFSAEFRISLGNRNSALYGVYSILYGWTTGNSIYNYYVLNSTYQCFFNTVTLTQFYFNLSYFNNFYFFNLQLVSYDFVFDSFYFYIKKPSYRVNNSLIIYNFNYMQYLSSSSGLTYVLSKDNNLYNVHYAGSVPNSKYSVYYNDELNNIIFDEYISFELFFNQNRINIDNYRAADDFPGFYIPLGFDFNFTYYTEPLVSNSGTYNYEFDKPGYVDMKFSLTPFHIPVLEAVENSIIFLLFYCPITSDIIELLNFDRFLGGLLSVFNLFIDSQIGNFIMGAFAFLILWGILSSLLPKALSSARSIYSNSQFAYNRRRNREYRQKERLQRKENNYKNKIQSKIDKQRRKVN